MRSTRGVLAGAIALTVALLTAFGCADAGSVTGTVTFEGRPAGSIPVTIADLTTTTSGDGTFTFDDVPGGDQLLTASLSLGDDDGFVERSQLVHVDGDVDLGQVTLPEPVELSLIDATTTTIEVGWTASADPGFREYRLYRGYDTALDDQTGKLIHVATDAGDTTFLDDGMDEDIGLSPGSDYTYRVYVSDEHGLLGGSNILEATTPMWDAEDLSVRYELTEVDQFALAHAAVGLAWDGSCLWVVTQQEVGGYYDNNDVWLQCRDLATGDTLVEHHYDDEYILASGAAWDGEALWLNYTQTGSGGRYVKRIDPDDGAVLGQYTTDDGVWDVDFDGTHLLLNNIWNQLDLLDPTSGAVVDSFTTPFEHSTCRGVAHRPGETWISSQAHDELVILDATGDHIGLATMPLLDPVWNYSWDLYMTFVGDRLAFVFEGRVYLFEPSEIAP